MKEVAYSLTRGEKGRELGRETATISRRSWRHTTRKFPGALISDEDNSFWISTDESVELPNSDFIGNFPGEPFVLLQKIPLNIRRIDAYNYLAEFEEANIGMSGDSREEAIENLACTILDTFENYEKEEHRLGKEPSRQLTVLRSYIRKSP